MTGQDRPPERFPFYEATLNALAFLGAAAIAALVLLMMTGLAMWIWRIVFGAA